VVNILALPDGRVYRGRNVERVNWNVPRLVGVTTDQARDDRPTPRSRLSSAVASALASCVAEKSRSGLRRLVVEMMTWVGGGGGGVPPPPGTFGAVLVCSIDECLDLVGERGGPSM